MGTGRHRGQLRAPAGQPGVWRGAVRLVMARGPGSARAEVVVTGFRIGLRGSPVAVERAVRRFAGGPAELAESLPDDRRASVAMAGMHATLDYLEQRGSIDLERGEVTVTDSLVVTDALVRAAVAWQASAADALLLHAVALPRAGAAVVCFGASGVGKSTLAAAAGDALCDELVLLRRGAGGWQVESTPWWRGVPGRLPLARLLWLVRGEAPSCQAVAGSALLRALCREAGRYFPDVAFQQRLFGLCAELASLGALRVAAGEGTVVADVEAALR